MTSEDSNTNHPADDTAHDFLEAFNAEDAVDAPGKPREEPDTTDDADAPAP